MSKNAVRNRRNKVELELVKPQTKEKFLKEALVIEAQQQAPVPKFTAATVNQKKQLQYLQEGRSAVWAIGAPGSGKSMVAAYHAACLLKQKKIEKILLIRPVVYVGNSIGMLSGSAEEKLAVWFKQTVAHLEKFLGKGFTHYCLDKGVIEYQAVEHLRGHSFEDVYVICEESQGLTFQEYEMLLTRVGKGGQVCFTGDERQSAAKDNSGLTKLMNLLESVIDTQPDYLNNDDLDTLDNDMGIVRYTIEDIQRSGFVKTMSKIYYFQKE